MKSCLNTYFDALHQDYNLMMKSVKGQYSSEIAKGNHQSVKYHVSMSVHIEPTKHHTFRFADTKAMQ
jgi:hypothetical protein